MLSATWFCLGNGFLGSRNLWVLSAEVFAALYGAFGKNCIGTRYVFMLLLDVPCPRLKQHYNGMARLHSQMDSRRFLKFQASRVSMWWIMGEGGSITIKLACRVQTLASSRHKLPLHVPRLTRFALTTWSIATCICEYYLFDSKPICLWEHMLWIPQPCGCYKICRYNADIYALELKQHYAWYGVVVFPIGFWMFS